MRRNDRNTRQRLDPLVVLIFAVFSALSLTLAAQANASPSPGGHSLPLAAVVEGAGSPQSLRAPPDIC